MRVFWGGVILTKAFHKFRIFEAKSVSRRILIFYPPSQNKTVVEGGKTESSMLQMPAQQNTRVEASLSHDYISIWVLVVQESFELKHKVTSGFHDQPLSGGICYFC